MILMAIATTLTTAMVMIVMAVHANDNDNGNSDGGSTWLIFINELLQDAAYCDSRCQSRV